MRPCVTVNFNHTAEQPGPVLLLPEYSPSAAAKDCRLKDSSWGSPFEKIIVPRNSSAPARLRVTLELALLMRESVSPSSTTFGLSHGLPLTIHATLPVPSALRAARRMPRPPGSFAVENPTIEPLHSPKKLSFLTVWARAVAAVAPMATINMGLAKN